ncbi:Kazal-like serine protease inhibitor domain and phox-like domain-containing protein [Phytophthora cinnamomi]|uniref:Kazal-like serine protease inhibitor domain and phox-like domain-containing protein n=1 Tax=Phytophthora cinnamomi TaxID=4785 RepID=UPI003559484F|nr:Kazal-like serine protease inhibitor domain and phox-like domain-containing protein [Phytophthora cinnamomi]
MAPLPIVVYPILSAFFVALSPREQVWLSLLLPLLKLSLRHLYHIMFKDVILHNAKSYQTFAFIRLFNTV